MNPRCQCGGQLKVYSTRPVGLIRVRYCRCDDCGNLTKYNVPIDAKGRVVKIANRNSNQVAACPCCGRTMNADSTNQIS
jgi:hypothetical protein